ncbi:MAG: excinuclease ABC subunit UvrC [Candidatus Helarchaeota archaeon]
MKSRIDSSVREQVGELPESTGVYLFKDVDGNALYIGKAKSIKKRVKSHVSSVNQVSTSAFIIENAVKIDYITTESEIEALLLESELIKKYKPKYNIELKDDKSFPHIVITKEEFPRVLIRRHRKKAELGKYRRVFGPFTSVGTIKRTLNFLFKIFPVCTCFPQRKNRVRPCLKYQLKRCPAPCVGKITQEEYMKNIVNIELILDGKKRDLIDQLKGKMAQAASDLDFEAAARLRDQIWALEKTIITQQVIASEPEIPLGMIELKNILNLPKTPVRIEAFDISNISGTDPTGSLVVFINGSPFKNGYRRFKVKTVVEPNDVAMMGEVIERRYKKLISMSQQRPDLIVVDGGKPQLNITKRILTTLKLEDIPVIGLAKRFEHVFKPGMADPIMIPPDSPALFLLQRVRDEAHRFALRYHQLLRKKRMRKQKS